MFTIKYIASDGDNGPIEVASIYSGSKVFYEYTDGLGIIQVLDDKGAVLHLIQIEDNSHSIVYVENAQGKTVQKFLPRFPADGISVLT